MERLLRTKKISGPHMFYRLQKHNVTILMLGEEHTNQNQCSADGADVVDLIKQLASDGIDIYLEMPLKYKSRNPLASLKCTRHKTGQSRKSVLNELRTCLYIFKHTHGAPNVHFVDPRERFGKLTFSAEEDKFIETMKRAPNQSLMHERFVKPLMLASNDKIIQENLSDDLLHEWGRKIINQIPPITNAIHSNSVQQAATLFRTASDNVMNIWTLSVLEHMIQRHHRMHVMYIGSAHVVKIVEMLQQRGFEIEDKDVQNTNVGCVRLTPQNV